MKRRLMIFLDRNPHCTDSANPRPTLRSLEIAASIDSFDELETPNDWKRIENGGKLKSKEGLTVRQDESRKFSGKETGALIVLRRATSEVLIPISNPQHGTIC